MGGQSIIVSFFIAATIGAGPTRTPKRAAKALLSTTDAESTVVATNAYCDGAADTRD